MCVIYLMRYLMEHFVSNTSVEADKIAQIREEQDFQHSEVKIPSVQLFTDLGRYFDRQLKQRMTDSKSQSKKDDTFDPSPIEKHLIIEDQHFSSMSKTMQVKVGAFLSNLMIKNLKFRVGSHEYMVLKPTLVGSSNK